VKPEAGSI